MGSILLDVPGKPMGKARPRVTRRGITYTPKATAERERLVQTCYHDGYLGSEPLEGPLAVVIDAIYPVPKSAPAKERIRMTSGEIPPTVRPDVDNVAKLVLDALNGTAYLDDSQVVSLRVSKRYAKNGEEPHTLVGISSVSKS